MGINIVKQPEDRDVKAGQKFLLDCKATNEYNKEMKYEWFRSQVDGMYSMVLCIACFDCVMCHPHFKVKVTWVKVKNFVVRHQRQEV